MNSFNTKLQEPVSPELVVITGAGANASLNMPLGTCLLKDINKHLNPEDLDNFSQLTEAVSQIVNKDRKSPFTYSDIRRSFDYIREQMHLAESIDNIIDISRGDPLKVACGKVAIAFAILTSERSSPLASQSTRTPLPTIDALRQSWMRQLTNIITEGCTIEDVHLNLRKVAFVTFNYDRCIEHFMFRVFSSLYSLNYEDAKRLMRNLRVHHVYGSLGPLPWQVDTVSQPWYPEFGQPSTARLIANSAKNIRTFTESHHSSGNENEEIRSIIDASRKLLILGFAFSRTNMRTIFTPASAVQHSTKQVCATAYDLDSFIVNSIKETVQNEYGIQSATMFQFRNDLRCDDIVEKYRYALSLSKASP